MEQKPIDFVLLWVDGEDEKWLIERDKYYHGEINQKKASAYRDWGTLKYWFRAVEEYAPWVRKIHFVTYGHLPKWLDIKNTKLHIVNHSDIIDKSYLPTFSANSIELNIHKIPGLAEQFVYFNDDTFLMSQVSPDDFFVRGLPRDTAVMSALIPSVKNEIFTYILFNDLLLINSNWNKRETMAKCWKKWFSLKYGKDIIKNLYYLPLGKFSGFQNYHLPNSFLKSTWEEVWDVEAKILEATVSRRFRTKEDVNQYIFRYWQLVTGRFIPRKKEFGKCYVIGQDDKFIEDAINGGKTGLLCVNDNPEEIDFEHEKQWLQSCFEKVLPKPSSFEVDC